MPVSSPSHGGRKLGTRAGPGVGNRTPLPSSRNTSVQVISLDRRSALQGLRGPRRAAHSHRESSTDLALPPAPRPLALRAVGRKSVYVLGRTSSLLAERQGSLDHHLIRPGKAASGRAERPSPAGTGACWCGRKGAEPSRRPAAVGQRGHRRLTGGEEMDPQHGNVSRLMRRGKEGSAGASRCSLSRAGNTVKLMEGFIFQRAARHLALAIRAEINAAGRVQPHATNSARWPGLTACTDRARQRGRPSHGPSAKSGASEARQGTGCLAVSQSRK